MCYGSPEKKERSCLEVSKARTAPSWQDQVVKGIVQRIGEYTSCLTKTVGNFSGGLFMQ